ncbi:MAG: glycosyltransferase family 2 protein [Terriglobales bacterium]
MALTTANASSAARKRATLAPTVSVLIPTKNRPDDLRETARSLLTQTAPPAEVIVVDQSAGDSSRCALAGLGRDSSAVAWRYFHEPEIRGATAALNFAMEQAGGDIWLFLDDDVRLEPEFIAALLRVYRNDPWADGVCGVITNYRPPSWRFRTWRRIFERGLFHDDRQPIYWRADDLRHAAPLPVSRFGSGLMSFRAEAIRDRRFDASLPGAPRGYDVDFCLQLGQRARLLVAPAARLEHKCGEVARIPGAWLAAEMRGARYLYRRHSRRRGAGLALAWLLAGYALLAASECLRTRSRVGWRAYWTGLRGPVVPPPLPCAAARERIA